VVIPPSIAMILYAISAEQSAVLLFTAGILPSLLIGVIDAAYVMGYARWKGVPLGPRANWAPAAVASTKLAIISKTANASRRRIVAISALRPDFLSTYACLVRRRRLLTRCSPIMSIWRC